MSFFNNVTLYKPKGVNSYCFKIPTRLKPEKRHFNTHTANKQEAEKARDEYLAQRMAQVNNQTFMEASLDRVIETYLESKKHLAESSYKKYKQTVQEFKDFIVSRLIKIPKIQEVEKPLIEAYLQSILDNGKSPQTRNDKRNILTNLFGYAVNNDWLVKNPVSKIGKIEETESEHPEPLSKDEVKNLLNDLKTLNLTDKKYRCKCYYEIMAIVYYAGLRISEVTHLFKSDVDFFKIDIHNKTIPKEYSGKLNKDGHSIAKEYKTKTRRNWETPIVPELEEILKQWMLKVKNNPSPLLFPNLNGCPIDTDDIYRVVKKRMISLGFPPDKINRPLHRGRHTFASITGQKLDEADVQKALGHKSNIMTRHYTHLTPEQTRDKFKWLSYGQTKKGKV